VAAEALRVALAQVGKPYQWGGAGPDSFDCSGLVMYSYEAAGVALPHYTGSQYADTARVAEADLQPGDLVFYGSPIHHVAMYDGDGRIVTADTTGTDVRVEPMTWDGTPVGFGRVG
jgi:cell wall-associated NlpC family hydrolase